jgi:orotate phosphoribosyltransferase
MMANLSVDAIRKRARQDLEQADVLLEGHFDYGNGYHGRQYVNPHMIFRYPSTIWRIAQDILDIVPSAVLDQVEAVVGPVTGGALLGHTIAGLLDGRRSLDRRPCLFAPIHFDQEIGLRLRTAYARMLEGRRVLIADDVRNTGKTLAHCAELVRKAGGVIVATVQIYDRMEAVVEVDVPNFALIEYRAPENYPTPRCPLCAAGVPLTTF